MLISLLDGAVGRSAVWTNVYGLARTLLALATCGTLAANSSALLFQSDLTGALHCEGLRAISLFCITNEYPELGRWTGVLILLVVVSGWRPSLTAPLHWWVTFSFASSATVIDGGDQLASILTLLILPIALLDRRKWHWSADPHRADERIYARTTAIAVWRLIRLQVAVVYLHAAVGKLFVTEWLDGTAMYYWLNDPIFGVPRLLVPVLNAFLRHAVVVSALTWGAILLELALFLALLAPPETRNLLLPIGLAFHIAIAAMFGLTSFSLVMAAALILYLRLPYKAFVPSAVGHKFRRDRVGATDNMAFPSPNVITHH